MKLDNQSTVSQEPAAGHHASHTKSKANIAMVTCGIVGLIGGAAMILAGVLMPKEGPRAISYPNLPSVGAEEAKYLSPLTGMPVATAGDMTAPTYCIQTPNGMDGARPQVGLNEAGVVFEAIAEAGITRFAAIYQNPRAAAIGPIRSLRLYYLQWDTPFDCTIVHAGGADDALAAVKEGGYKDLSENYTYMYRSYGGSRAWNNLFTTGAYLARVNTEWGYGESQVNGFARMTPEESRRARIDGTVAEKLSIVKPAAGNTSAMAPRVSGAAVNFGGYDAFNVTYEYNAEANNYNRVYGTGEPAYVYVCPDEDMGEPTPENVCSLSTMTPSVVVAMMVEEHKAEDNYHEDIAAIGSGEAYVFQNGMMIHGTWNKASADAQIKFIDEKGTEIKLAPGQTFVEAVPNYGSIASW